MPRPSQPRSAERMLLFRVVIALGLAVLLLVGAWTDSHGESSTGSPLCVAAGSASTSVSDPLASASPVATDPDAGLLGVCALVVFLLLLVGQRMLREQGLVALGRAVTASVRVRAGPRRPLAALTLAQLSLSRT